MRKTPTGPRLDALVGVRELHEIGRKGEPFVIRLGKPRRVAGGDWACPYHISRIRMRRAQCAYGIDAIQALLMAVEGIKVALDKSGKQFSWAGGEPGTGLTRLIPIAFGSNFAKQLEDLVEREVQKIAQNAQAEGQQA